MLNRWGCLAVALIATVATVAPGATGAAAGDESTSPAIRLIVRADDIGSCHSANVACIRTCVEGLARSVEVMVPTPWFKEGAAMLREHPDIDVGVHLTLTSEWDHYKWGPVTHAPSLVDRFGHFLPMTSQRSDYPPNTGFLQAEVVLEEVERELRAQIELARSEIPSVSHLTCHMGLPIADPRLRDLTLRLADEYGLPVVFPGLRGVPRGLGGQNTSAEQKVEIMVDILEGLEPGDWLLVDHPGLDTDEMRAMGHKGYEQVAHDRVGVTAAFTSARAMDVVRRRGIALISYGDYIRSGKADGE